MPVCRTSFTAMRQGYNCRDDEKGFTLLELLITVSILAAVAALAATGLSGVLSDTEEKLAVTEMQTIAQAVRQFKRDTGYYPKTGPFNLDVSDFKGSVDLDALRRALIARGFDEFNSTTGSMRDDIDLVNWFNSPGNLYQLVWKDDNLPAMNDHILETWSPETGRGWNGPYLVGLNDGVVDIGSGANKNSTPAKKEDIDGDKEYGDPAKGTSVATVNVVLAKVFGIADPFLKDKLTSGIFTWWRRPVHGDRGNWEELGKHGQPYLIFDLSLNPLLVSLGPDGKYNTSDDIDLEVE